MGFQKSEADLNLYFIMVGDDLLILLLYVDDLFIQEERSLLQFARKILLQSMRWRTLGWCTIFWDWRFCKSLVIFSRGKKSMQLIFWGDFGWSIAGWCLHQWSPTEKNSCLWGRVGGSYTISSAHWFVDVSGQLSARFVFCSKHSQTIHAWA